MTDANFPPRKPGRPSNAEMQQRRAAMAGRNPRAPVQSPVREPELAPSPLGDYAERASAAGRIPGEILTRARAATSSDIFYVPPDIVPHGWDYQWNPHEVMGKPFDAIERNMSISMYQNGWRPVPAGRHPGLWMPHGTEQNSAIVVDGLRLDERPMVLTEEAKYEDWMAATGQVKAKIDEYSKVAKGLPDGFTRDNSRLRSMERQQTHSTMAPAPDAPRPQYSIDPE